MSGPYSVYSTDKTLEERGVWVDFGGFELLVARSGGSNRKFASVLERKTKPFRQQMSLGVLDEETNDRLYAEVFAESVILDWRSQQGATVSGPDGNGLGPYTPEKGAKLLLDLPDLFAAIRKVAGDITLFRDVTRELDAGN